MSDFIADSTYDWTFYAYSGDAYTGWTVEDTGTFVPGQAIHTDAGLYAIEAETAHGGDLAAFGWDEGLVYIDSYFDAYQGSLTTLNYWQYGAPSAVDGLGTEYDYAWNGAYWDSFGFGGYDQAGYFG